ncbi:MAG: FAS1-like dehydratase domain-containing protein, partial [Mycobacterium sp.]
PVVTSVVTMLGESIHQDAETAAATVAAIASIRGDA